ncbi:RNA recognition motif domain containing protein [Acanthamoeba castellanii str. Neff]|uniref:RNA recognition motif domain containing protein n=1 Tax=Acanthamoeba castellanii (strain ATCC 30010 / Neff) TaxID=1257118 RepID=L8HA59_ACACF|nr:RNA recognition motif domain containing protein [Acanthamoeba castellanii str. Neff]ELR21326.1 RNA recognition motif domain containing protein [Acanthamoeba castellanii str. Neff]
MQENAPWPSDPNGGHSAGNGTGGGGNRDGFQHQHHHQQQRVQYDVGDEPPLEYGIFVSDIARGVTDQELKDAFSSAGQVTDALVVKNKFTGETKGFGFVKFATLDAVHAALDMAVLPSFRDAVSARVQTVKVVRADPKNVLYVGNIPRGLSEDDVRLALQEATTTYEVTKFKLCTTLEGESKGYGWATFKDHKCAVQGMRLLQSTPVFGLYLNVHMAEPRTQEEDMLARVKSLFVRGVSPTTNAEAMKAFFGDGCEKVVIPLDVTTRAVLGHAFVHFATRQQAEAAMQRCQNATLEGESGAGHPVVAIGAAIEDAGVRLIAADLIADAVVVTAAATAARLHRLRPTMAPPAATAQAYGHHQPAYAPPPPPAAYSYGDPATAYSQPGYHPAPAATPTPAPAPAAGAGDGTTPVAPAGTGADATAATNYSQQHQYNYYAGAATSAAPGADPYYGAYGAYDQSRAGPAYAYPPAPPPDYTGYYGSPAGGKALAPRDAPRYNPY